MKMPSGIKSLVLLSSAAILSASSLTSHASDSRFAGYLLDRSCADNMKTLVDYQDMIKAHKKECALNDNCSKNGYSIYSKGKFLQLDKKGSELARDLLKTTKTKEGHFVVVTGSVNKDEIKVTSLKELASSGE